MNSFKIRATECCGISFQLVLYRRVREAERNAPLRKAQETGVFRYRCTHST